MLSTAPHKYDNFFFCDAHSIHATTHSLHHLAPMPPGKLDLSKSIFAQPPPEVPTSASKNRKLSVTEQLSELQKLTAEQEASYAAKKAEVDSELGKEPGINRTPPPIPPAGGVTFARAARYYDHDCARAQAFIPPRHRRAAAHPAAGSSRRIWRPRSASV